jgi:hypothetical protein
VSDYARAGNTGLLSQRCDPYGAESRIKLMGGMYPESYNGPQHWFCRNPATHRVVMRCRNGHHGDVMPLCDTHHAEIQRRQSGTCLTCAHPPEARACLDEIEHAQKEIQDLVYRQGLHLMDPLVLAQQRKIQRGAVRMTELRQTGRTPNIPLTLTEVS